MQLATKWTAVELGIQSIQPLLTERSIIKLDRERADKKIEHWRTVAISACEQTGRSIIPDISSPTHLTQWLSNQNQTTDSLKLILTPAKAQNLNHLKKPLSPVVFMGCLRSTFCRLRLVGCFVSFNIGNGFVNARDFE